MSLSGSFSTLVTNFLQIAGYGGGGQQPGAPAPQISNASAGDFDDEGYVTPPDITDDVDGDTDEEEGYSTAPEIPDDVDADTDDEDYVTASDSSDDADDQTAIDEARRLAAEFEARFARVKDADPAGAEFVATFLAYVRAKGRLDQLLADGDGRRALEFLPGCRGTSGGIRRCCWTEALAEAAEGRTRATRCVRDQRR